MPVAKAAGDLVFGSTVNQLGSLIMLAQGVGKDTALNQVVRLVQVIFCVPSRQSSLYTCGPMQSTRAPLAIIEES